MRSLNVLRFFVFVFFSPEKLRIIAAVLYSLHELCMERVFMELRREFEDNECYQREKSVNM